MCACVRACVRGHVLCSSELLPLLRATAAQHGVATISVTTSSGHYDTSHPDGVLPEYLQPVPSEYLQPVPSEYLQPVPSEHLQPVPSEHLQPVPSDEPITGGEGSGEGGSGEGGSEGGGGEGGGSEGGGGEGSGGEGSGGGGSSLPPGWWRMDEAYQQSKVRPRTARHAFTSLRLTPLRLYAFTPARWPAAAASVHLLFAHLEPDPHTTPDPHNNPHRSWPTSCWRPSSRT
jgi:hypothetical protein